MIDTNYCIEALEYLLDEKCLRERYYPLIPFKKELLAQARTLGCQTKNDVARLSDSEFAAFGIQDEETVRLLRRFLKMYDPNPQKFKEIEKLNVGSKEQIAFRELYFLPGVKYTRASLYFHAGYQSLKEIAEADPKEILEKTASAISTCHLSCIVPLPKEVATHIAVAKAFTKNRNESSIK